NINVQEVARTSNYTGEEPIDRLPVADITVFQGEPHSEAPSAESCFVLYSYYNYPLTDSDAAYADYFDRKDTSGGELESFEPIIQTIDTFEGVKEYDLHQYRLVFDKQDT